MVYGGQLCAPTDVPQQVQQPIRTWETCCSNQVNTWSCHLGGWNKAFVSCSPFPVPQTLEIALLWVGGGNVCGRLPRCLWTVTSSDVFRFPQWQIFVLTHCGYFNVIMNPSWGNKSGLIMRSWDLEISKTRTLNPAPSFPSLSFFICERGFSKLPLPQGCVCEPS